MGVVKRKRSIWRRKPAAKMHFAFVLPFALLAAVSGGVVPATLSQNAVTSSQFHSQDEAGNFAFGYSNPLSHREESGNVETGVVRGSYTNAWGKNYPLCCRQLWIQGNRLNPGTCFAIIVGHLNKKQIYRPGFKSSLQRKH